MLSRVPPLSSLGPSPSLRGSAVRFALPAIGFVRQIPLAAAADAKAFPLCLPRALLHYSAARRCVLPYLKLASFVRFRSLRPLTPKRSPLCLLRVLLHSSAAQRCALPYLHGAS